ncbi:MAG: hypothetical protein ACJZ70_07280 [Limisphaerales bacterium]
MSNIQSKNELPTLKAVNLRLKIRSGSGHDTSIYTSVELNSGTTYALSAWIKTESVNGEVTAHYSTFMSFNSKVKRKLSKGTNDWQKVELVFECTQTGSLTINCLFGGWGQAKGTAWYDELSLQEVKPIYQES